MPLHVIHVACDLCSGVHSTEIAVKLDDGPQVKESVADFFAGKAVPEPVAVRDQTFRCPATGQKFSPRSDDNVFLLPAPYRV